MYKEHMEMETFGDFEETEGPKFPNAKVYLRLNGPSGNALAIMYQVTKALNAAGASPLEEAQFISEAKSAESYENFLTIVGKWCKIV